MKESGWTVVWIDNLDMDRYEVLDEKADAQDLVQSLLDEGECHSSNILIFPPNSNINPYRFIKEGE